MDQRESGSLSRWLGIREAPPLDVPEGVSKEEQLSSLMRRHVVHRGWSPGHSFLLYVENRPDGLVFHEGVGTVGRDDTAVDRDYQYNVASITKMVVPR